MEDPRDNQVQAAWELGRSRPLPEAIDALATRFGLRRDEASLLIWNELFEPTPQPLRQITRFH